MVRRIDSHHQESRNERLTSRIVPSSVETISLTKALRSLISFQFDSYHPYRAHERMDDEKISQVYMSRKSQTRLVIKSSIRKVPELFINILTLFRCKV